jgi:hypothetical protein
MPYAGANQKFRVSGVRVPPPALTFWLWNTGLRHHLAVPEGELAPTLSRSRDQVGVVGNEPPPAAAGHQTPHFHAAYAGQRASLGLDGTVLAGSLPPRTLKLVRQWASLHQAELVANWRRARAQRPLRPIDPLP